MKHSKKLIVWFLILVFLFSLAGCKHDSKSKSGSGEANIDTSNTAPRLYASRFTYDVGELNDVCTDGDGYLLATSGGIRLLDGQYQLSEEILYRKNATALTAHNGIPVYVARSQEEDLTLYEGNDVLVDKPHFMEGQLLVQGETVWFCTGNGMLLRNDVDLELPQQPGTEWHPKALLQTGDGLFAVVTEYQDRENEAPEAVSARLVPLDGEMTSLPKNEGLVLPKELWVPSYVSSPESGCLVVDGELWRLEGKTFALVADLTKYGVNQFSLRRVLVTDSGDILCLEKDVLTVLSANPPQKDSEDQTGAEDPASPAEPKLLRVAIGPYTDLSFLNDLVSYLNRTDAGYQVTLKGYREEEKLNRAILAGEVDAIATGDISLIRNYAKRGLLVPVDELLPDLFSSEQMYSNVFDALKMNGSLYLTPVQIIPHFCEMPRKYEVGPDSIKSMQDLVALLEEKEPLCFECGMKRVVLREDWLPWTLNQWYDPETGTVNFDCPEFIEVLEFCNRYFLTEAEYYASEAASFARRYPGEPSFLVIGSYREFNIEHWMGNEPFTLPFVGMSTASMEIECGLAFVNQADPEAVSWILETMLTDEGWHELIRKKFQGNSGNYFSYIFPNREWTVENLKWLEDRVILYATSTYREHHAEDFHAAVEQTDALFAESQQLFYYHDRELFNIVMEEAEVYFNGDITAAEAARRIQNRVEIYLAERG